MPRKTVVETSEEIQRKPEPVQYKTPQADEDGTIPQFVNVTGKVQVITIPYDPTHSIPVPAWGILEGAQWRKPYATANGQWRNPPFRERIKDKSGEYDPKYVLTEEQTLKEIDRLWTNDVDEMERVRKRVRALVDNMILFEGGRRSDDRVEVLRAMDLKVRKIEDRKRKIHNGN